MIRYFHDLYPRTDPKDGARLVRFTKHQLTSYLHQRNGTGSGKVALRATTPDAAFISPLGLDYNRVVRINTAVVDGATLSGFSEKVVGGYFFEEGDFLALDRRLRKLLTLSGAGTLSVLDRAVMWSHSYMTTPFIGTDPQPGFWPLYLAGTGNELGAILWRVITEALNFENPAVAADDRTESAIGMVTMTFTHLVDSDGNPWTVSSGDFVAQVGESVLSVVKRLMEAGLYVEMDPDTFELSAWEVAEHGRDRTGGAWGTNVLRFERPADQVADNGNILSDLKRAIRAIVRRSKLLAGSAASDVYATADGTTDVPWEGFYSSDAGEAVALEKVAERQVGARDDAGDTVQVRIKVGNDPANGRYLLGEHIQTDDLATLHTGTDEWEWDEAAYPVAAWSVTTRRSGAPDAWAHLGAIYHSTADRAFQAAGHVGPHTHRPNPELCRPMTAVAPTVMDYGVNTTSGSDALAWSLTGTGTGGKDLTIDAGDADRALYVFVLHRHDGATPTPVWRRAGPIDEALTLLATQGSFGATGTMSLFRLLSPTAGTGQVLVANAAATRVGGFYLHGVNQAAPEADVAADDPVAVTSAGVAVSGGAMYLDAAGMVNAGEASVANPSPSGTQTQAWSVSVDSGADDSEFGGSYGDATPVWTSAASRKWATAAVAVNGSTGTAGDGRAELIGTSIRAKRCDDTEHYHTTADPTVNDDTSLGFRNNTLWINESSGAIFLLLDNAEGAADWLPVGGAVETLPVSIIDAKGDLIAGTAADSADNLPAGSNGSGLVTASGETTGLKWRKHNDAAAAAPTVNDDSGDGYEVGSHWLDTTNDKEYVLLDATVGAAVWKERTNVTGGGATIVVREVAGTDIEDVAELEFDASDFVVTEPSAGIARVELASPGGSGALTLLSHTVLGSAAANITATGLSGSYKDLVIVVRGRSTDAGAGIGLDMRVGSGSIDTGSNYSYLQSYTGWATGANGSTGATLARVGSIPNSGATAGSFGVCIIEIVNYADAAKWRGWVGQAFAHDGSGTLRSEVGGFWKNAAAAIDQVRVLGSAGNLDTGSALTIYGRG